ncbi:MAG: type VI secretion system ATPase TssH, partial [Clostridia bacterium]|nr:type VI secretion system ATPase TssH [Clostridia bacterium]
MNMQKLTQKSMEALQSANSIGVERHHQSIGQEHLLLALLKADEGLVPELWRKMGLDPYVAIGKLEAELGKLPQISGSGYDPERIYISNALDQALNAAEAKATAMKDDYVSVEHLVLGLLEKPQPNLKRIFAEEGITPAKFLAALKEVRGNARVTGDNPEDTYDVLNKYGQDLVELARQQKLDPVIGRDDEIRNVVRILSRKTKNNPCLIGEPGVGKT